MWARWWNWQGGSDSFVLGFYTNNKYFNYRSSKRKDGLKDFF